MATGGSSALASGNFSEVEERPGSAKPSVPDASSVAPYRFASPPPYAHQRVAFDRLVQSDGVHGLFYEVGTGKSRCVLDYVSWLAHSTGRQVRVLITAPRSVQDTWVLESAKWQAPQVPIVVDVLTGSIVAKAEKLAEPSPQVEGAQVHIRVVNYETLSSRRQVKGSRRLHSDILLSAVQSWAPHVLVAEESHMLKGTNSNVGRLMYRISKKVDRRILLTGSPSPHSPLDFYSQARVLDENIFSVGNRPMTLSQFTATFARTGGYMGKQIVGWRRLDLLERCLKTRTASLRKQDCLDLPPTTDTVLRFRLSAREQAAYDRIRKTMVLQLESGVLMSAPSMLVLRLRLRQIACGFVKDDNTERIEWLGTSRQEAAVERLRAILGADNRCVVFGWSRIELDALSARLDADMPDVVVYTVNGDTSDADRLRYRQEFGRRDATTRIFLAQIATISMGINELVSSSNAIFLSLSEQRSHLVQAKGRLDRPGQLSPVVYTHLEAAGTVDEVIRKSHEERSDLEASLLAHLKGE